MYFLFISTRTCRKNALENITIGHNNQQPQQQQRHETTTSFIINDHQHQFYKHSCQLLSHCKY